MTVTLRTALPWGIRAGGQEALAPARSIWPSVHTSQLCSPEAWPSVTSTSPVDSFLRERSITTLLSGAPGRTLFPSVYRRGHRESAQRNHLQRSHSERDKAQPRLCRSHKAPGFSPSTPCLSGWHETSPAQISRKHTALVRVSHQCGSVCGHLNRD